MAAGATPGRAPIDHGAPDVGYAPDSEGKADIALLRIWANSRHPPKPEASPLSAKADFPRDHRRLILAQQLSLEPSERQGKER